MTFKEAISGPERELWRPAIKRELDSMNQHNIWTIVSKTKDRPIVPVKWIFHIKHDGTRKARLVAVGCRDPEKYSPTEKFSLTPRSDTNR